MDHVVFQGGSINIGTINNARTFRERWRGLKELAEGSAVLIKTRSVHGFGVKTPFRAVGLTSTFEVVETRVVKPRRVVSFPRCRYVLELPMEAEAPQIGETLELRSV